jgi:hypothetical protein
MSIWDYRVQFVYGYSKAYGSKFHTGEDRPAPRGTPVTKVTEIDTAGKTPNGRFVRVQSGNYSWVYLHLDKVLVKVGQTLKGGEEMFNTMAEVKEAYIQMRGHTGSDAEMRAWLGQSKQRWIQLSTKETSSTRQQLADVKKALENLKKQPPKEVVKIVEKIVTKTKIEKIKVPVEIVKEVNPSWLTKVIDFINSVLKSK